MFSVVVSDDGAVTRFIAKHFLTGFEGFGKRTEILSPDDYSELPEDFFPSKSSVRKEDSDYSDFLDHSEYSKWRVVCVQRAHNPTLLAAFAVRSLQYRAKGSPTDTEKVVHATPIGNAYSILEKNLQPMKICQWGQWDLLRLCHYGHFTNQGNIAAKKVKRKCPSIAMIVFEILIGKSTNTFRERHFYDTLTSHQKMVFSKEKSHEFLPTHVIYLNNPCCL